MHLSSKYHSHYKSSDESDNTRTQPFVQNPILNYDYRLSSRFNQLSFYVLLVLSLISIISISCTQPLVLKIMSSDELGYFMFGKLPQRIFYEDVNISDSLQLKWIAETSGSYSNSSVIISNNTLFVSDLSGRLYAFDRITGKMIGYEKFLGSLSIAPVIQKLRIYFVLNEKEEYYSTFKVHDFVNGKILHEERIEGSVSNELLRLEDGIVVLSDRGELIKFNYAGIKIWSVNTQRMSLCSPVSNNELIILGNQYGEIVIVDNKEGKIIFREKFCNGIESSLTLDNNIIYFADIRGNLFALDINTKKVKWIFNTGSRILSTPVYNSDRVFIGNLAGNIFAVDKGSGKKLWQLDTKGVINTTPLLLRNFLVQPDLNKKIHLINPSFGLIVKTIEFETRVKLTPVYYDGLIYFGLDRGQIHAYSTFESKSN